MEFDDKPNMYSIHPLVYDWICVRISNGKATHASAQCILGMSVSWKFGLEDYSFRQTLLPHIDAVLQGGTATGPNLFFIFFYFFIFLNQFIDRWA